MNKKYSFILILLLTTFVSLQAQTKKGQLAISASFGASLLSWEWSVMTSPAVNYKAPPAYQGFVDYALLDKLSIGGAFSYQKVSSINRGYTYVNTSGQKVTEDVVNSLTRMNFSYRLLFHYVGNDKIDIYSGIRMGVNYYQDSHTSRDLNYNLQVENGFKDFKPAPQIIGLGIRMYIIQDLAINTEIAIGYPSFFSFGLTYRM